MKKRKHLWAILPLLGCISMGGSTVLDAAPAPPSISAPAPATIPDPTGAHPLVQADVDSWLDGYMPYALRTGDVAGAVVVVVKDGQIVTERGFGYSDVAAKKPVDPKSTLFRPGSTSKLFTWTAVMQQVQAGKIDLDADVNTYLDFKIPPYQGKPVTMREIMTHTAGFEEDLGGLMIPDGSPVPSLEATVKHWVPKRVYAPGTTPAYSNYATMLAGYIVQRVSGEPYDDYIKHHILDPLGMTHSTFVEPLAPDLKPYMSKGYKVASQPAKPFEIITFRPAGSATVTADDMAKFMNAHLNEDNNPLLNPATAKMMHTTALTLLPPLNRMKLGFYEANVSDEPIIAHGGDTLYFHSYLWLMPDHKTGVFFSMNSAGKGLASLTIRQELIEQFMDRYYPAAPAAPTGFTPNPADAALVAGTYESSRRSESGIRRGLNFFSQDKVTADAAGNLHLSGALFAGANGEPRQWVEIAPFVWKDANGKERLAAKVEDGKVTRFGVDQFSPFEVNMRVPWWQSTSWISPAGTLSLLVLLTLILSLPLGFAARRYYTGTMRLADGEKKTYFASVALAAATVVILISWMMTLTGLTFQALSAMVYLLEVATIVVLPVSVAVDAWFLVLAFKSKRGWFSVLWRALIVLSAFFLLWGAVAFNLTHIGLNY